MQDFKKNLTFGYRLEKGGEKAVGRITASTGFFTDEETAIAEELALEHIEKGANASGYHFITISSGGNIIGYTCYGRIPGSDTGFDLYWIVVDKRCERRGYGKMLLHETERLVVANGGKNIYAETSSTPLYAPTRAFYEHNGYLKEASLKDFYRDGDDKVFYSKRLV